MSVTSTTHPIATEQDLLRRFARTRTSQDFTPLVHRTAAIVYASARRQLRDEHLAGDVTQAVYLLLWKKPHAVRGSLAGWLLTTTRYCARNAARIALRRKQHEIEAATMRLREDAQGSDPLFEAYADHLDGALAELSTAQRDAVVMRYFQQMSWNDIARATDTSEEAARKRSERAVERLRAILSTKGQVPGAAILGAQLGVHGVLAPPAHLLHSLSALTSVSAQHSIFHLTLKTMTYAKTKLAVAALVAFAAAGGAAVTLKHLLPVASTVTVAQPSPKGSTSLANNVVVLQAVREMQLPGLVQLVRYDVALDDKAMPALLSSAGAPAAAGNPYVAYKMDAAQVAAAMNHANQSNLANFGTQLSMTASASSSAIFASDLVIDNPSQWYISQSTRQQLGFRGSLDAFAQKITRTDAHHAHIALTSQPGTATATARQNGAWKSQSIPNVSLAASTDVAAGQSLVLVGTFTVGTAHVNHVIVYEAFMAPDDEQQLMLIRGQNSATWWCTYGPETLRQWARDAKAWRLQLPPGQPPFSLDNSQSLSKQLSDGKVLYFDALTIPSQYPGCWWNPHGAPSLSAGLQLNNGKPERGTIAQLRVFATAAENALQNPEQAAMEGESAKQSDMAAGVSVEPTVWNFIATTPISGDHFTVGISVGPWAEVGQLKLDQPTSVDGNTFRLTDLTQPSADLDSVQLHQDGPLLDQYALVLHTKDGKTVYSDNLTSQWYTVDAQSVQSKTSGSLGFNPSITRASVDHFSLIRRRREYATFSNFATKPSTPPPHGTTIEQLAALQAQADRAEAERVLQQQHSRLAKFEEVPVDINTPLGTMRAAEIAARNQDFTALRARLSGDANESAMLDSLAHAVLLMQSINDKALKHFGESNVIQAFPDGAILDVGTFLATLDRRTEPDGSLTCHRGGTDVIHVQKNAQNGQYQLRFIIDVKEKLILPLMLARLTQANTRLDDPALTLDQLKALIQTAIH